MNDIEYMLKKENVIPFIKNRKPFVTRKEVNYHPSSIDYLLYWKEEKKRCIEGFWANDSNSEDEFTYRFMPGNLYFYINHGTILHRPSNLPKTAPKKPMAPILRDFEWAYAYNWLEARGFSGFEGDQLYTCCNDINDTLLSINEYDPTCFNDKGELKTFIPARDYIRKHWKEPMGRPLFQNQAKNLMLLGARGGGKSWFAAIAIILYEILFDGAKQYDMESILHPYSNEIFVGSGMASKSSELLSKVKLGINNLLGQYVYGNGEIEPPPFYKFMRGSLKPNNAQSPWEHRYDKKIGGEWKPVGGSGSKVVHGVFTTENPEAAAGGRPGIIVVEEVGLTPNVITIHGSNEAAQMTDGTVKFGTTLYIGTGGNIEKVVESQMIFEDPIGFNMLAFENPEGGNTCWFVSATVMDGNFKDENGNTKYDVAEEHYRKRRIEKRGNKTTSKALDAELMNYPLVSSEMFLNVEGTDFPVASLKRIYSHLITNESLLNASLKGHYVLNADGKPKFVADENLKPIREFPFKGNDDMNGCIEIFEPPVRNADGSIDFYTYIAGYDPVDDDGNIDKKRSLQSVFVMNTFTGRIVAEYTGRTNKVLEFYEQVRRLLLDYNCSICYENQKKGFYGYMYNKNCLYLLADTPEILRDKGMLVKIGSGNTNKGVFANEQINRWGIELQIQWLEEQAYSRPEGVSNMDLIRSAGYLKEAIMYKKGLNVDRIRSMGMLQIYRQELYKIVENRRKEIKTDKKESELKQHARLVLNKRVTLNKILRNG